MVVCINSTLVHLQANSLLSLVCNASRHYYAPASVGWEHYEMMAGVCPSVCLSVCRVPWPNSKTERPRKPKIGRMEAHYTGNPWTYLDGQKVKGQGHRVTKCKSIAASWFYLLCTRKDIGTATLNSHVVLTWLFLYTSSYSRIRLGDRVAGVSYAPYACLGITIFLKFTCFIFINLKVSRDLSQTLQKPKTN